MEIISLCVSDIPKEKIKKHKNGKKYLSIVVAERKEKDQFDNDLYVFISQTKEEREAKADKIYVGSGQTKSFKNEGVSVQDVEDMPSIGDDDSDLPF